MTLDVPLTRDLPIQVDWVGRLPENLVLVRTTTIPETVRVIGGSKILEKVDTIYTTPLRLDNLTKSGTINTTIVLSPPSLKLAPGSSDRVTVSYSIVQRASSDRR